MGPLDVELPSCGKQGLGTRLEVSVQHYEGAQQAVDILLRTEGTSGICKKNKQKNKKTKCSNIIY